MIRSAKALLLVLSLGCASIAQTPSGTANSPESSKSGIYYHFAMARLYAELAASDALNQSGYVTKAIQHYRDALKLEPSNKLVFEELTELYVQAGRPRDAVTMAEELLKENPDNLDARRMLGRIYTRAISSAPEGRINQSMLASAIEQYQKVTEKEPKDVESWVILGRLQRVANNTAESEKAYNAALAVDPSNEDALTGLAMMYADMGDNERAIEKLNAATQNNPAWQTLAALAEAYERTRDFPKAAETLQRALELNPGNPRLRSALARDLLYSDQYDAALKIYQDAANEDPREAEWLRIAEIYRAKRDLGKAREALDKAKRADGADLEVAYEEVNLLSAEGNTEQAIAKLKDVLKDSEQRSYSAAQASNRAMLLERLALLHREISQWDEAIQALRQIGTLNGDSALRVTVLMIDTYRQAKDLASAQKEAEAALAKYPEERMAHVAHAAVLSDLGKFDQAVAEINALPKGDRDRDNQLELAQIYEKARRWSDMGKALDAAEKLSTTDDERETVYFMKGAMFERLKKFDEAEAMFRKVLQANPENAGAANYLGYMLADRGVRLEEARELISKALEIDPHNGAYLDSLGWVYYRLGKLKEAEETLERAIARVGQDPTVRDHLGDVYFKNGKIREAIAQWQVSVKEYQRGSQTAQEAEEMAKVNRKLESARVRLAKETQKKP